MCFLSEMFFLLRVTYFFFKCVICCGKKAEPKLQPAFDRMNTCQFLAQIKKHPVRPLFFSMEPVIQL